LRELTELDQSGGEPASKERCPVGHSRCSHLRVESQPKMDPTTVRAETFLLCEHVTVMNELFFILSGGISKLAFKRFPGMQSLEIAVRIVVPITTINHEVLLEVRLEDENGEDLIDPPMRPSLRIRAPVDLADPDSPANLARGEELATNFRLAFPEARFTQPGSYTFRLFHEERELARTSFIVVEE
jgi:hypothetical protein